MMTFWGNKHYRKGIFIISLLFILPYCTDRENQQKRSSKWLEYSAVIESDQKQLRSLEGSTLEIHFKIQNRGRMKWQPWGKNHYFLSYHLLDGDKNILKFDNPRFPFPQTVRPSQTVDMAVKIKCPLEKGKYILEFDIVREGIAWFKEHGSRTLNITLSVEERIWPEDNFDISLEYGQYTKWESSVPEFTKLHKLIRITLSYNDIMFQGKTGTVHGFSAGSDYPQIWLRDAATIMPASQYYYPLKYLCSWIEEHLAYQDGEGSLEDWIDAQGKSDKNTTETDQETSAVEAARFVAQLTGTDWLRGEILGESVISRLERAINYVFTHRFDKKLGLVTGAHTADWGDVDMNHSDHRAIYVDESTHWTADIYDQAMVHNACRALSWMEDALGHEEKSRFWEKRAEIIRRNANRYLWQEEKGFYRVHMHLDSLRHDFDEDNIFAMGGNVQAVLSGLADEKKAERIINEAVSRQKTFGISTLSGVLLPPYPHKTFRHPLLDDPYEYQNGGQWDWFGGKLLYAMFDHGFSRAAKAKFLEIARKNLANGGFFEWDSREGIPRGSDFFAGSAGSLAKALLEGYFGIKISKKTLCLEPKLDRERGKIHLYIPASDLFVAYEYEFVEKEQKILFRFNSNFPHRGEVRILLPQELSGELTSRGMRRELDVKLNGIKIPFRVERKNQDECVVVETDFLRRSLEVSLGK